MDAISSLNNDISMGYPYGNPLATRQEMKNKGIERRKHPYVFAVTKISAAESSRRGQNATQKEKGNLIDIYV